jgi:hypothetical protein
MKLVAIWDTREYSRKPLARPHCGGLTTDQHKHIVWIVRRLRGRVRPLVAFSLACKLVAVLVLGPLSAALLSLYLQQWGRCSVGNFELASFLLSPIGAAASVTLGTIGVAAIYFELAGLLLLLADEHPSIRRTLGHLVRRLRSLCVLALHQVAWYVLLALPFLVAACSVLFWLWSGKDVNGLIVLRPPVFWIGAGIAGGLSVVYGVLALRLFLRWLLSVPALLLSDDTSAKQAMAVSGEAGRGQDAPPAGRAGRVVAASIGAGGGDPGAVADPVGCAAGPDRNVAGGCITGDGVGARDPRDRRGGAVGARDHDVGRAAAVLLCRTAGCRPRGSKAADR